MTLVEFLAPLKRAPNRDRVVGVLYYEQRYRSHQDLTVDEIRSLLRSARTPNARRINVADVLTRCGHLVDSPASAGKKRLWRLTNSGELHVRELLGLPAAELELEHDVSTLDIAARRIADADVRDFVEEAIKCLQVNALRAAVVFLWVGAIRLIQHRLLPKGSAVLTPALQKHDPKARNVSTLDHFAYVKDKTVLLAAAELGLFDKNEKDTLEEALGLRNRCGHPSKYKPGAKKVSGFIEDLIQIVLK